MKDIDLFSDEMGLNQCRYCKNFKLSYDGDYITCCDTYSTDNPFTGCKEFKLDDDLKEIVKFFKDYK